MTLEELGWSLVTNLSNESYLAYNRNNEYLYVDLDKRKIVLDANEITFSVLEAIRKIVIENAIY